MGVVDAPQRRRFYGWCDGGFVLQSPPDHPFSSPGPGLPLPRDFGVGAGSAGPASLEIGQSPAPGGIARICPPLQLHPPFSAISWRVWDLVVNPAVV